MSPASRTNIQAGAAQKSSIDTKGRANFEFHAQGKNEVKVILSPSKTAQAKALPSKDPDSQEGFTLIRLVMNLEVPGGVKNDEIEIHVKAQDGETKLAYYDTPSKRWEIISQSKENGYFVARRRNWPEDPSIGAGR